MSGGKGLEGYGPRVGRWDECGWGSVGWHGQIEPKGPFLYCMTMAYGLNFRRYIYLSACSKVPGIIAIARTVRYRCN